jgi:tetratricopeptide (TPR) repeat protein
MLTSAVQEPIGSPPGSGPQRYRIQTTDGLAVDMGQVAAHWELARMLLDYVRPGGMGRSAPARDEMVRRWYVATAAWMQAVEQHDTVHLDRARTMFPDDPDILFWSGCQHEIYAGPPIQSAIHTAVVPAGVKFDVSSSRGELRDAETWFRKAIAGNPANAEARLRHGRVLALLDRPRDAIDELRQALEATDDPLMRYYAALFMGAAAEALHDLDGARQAYEEARELFPAAQSPHIALSALSRRRGDRAGAWSEMQQWFEVGGGERANDPWWRYYVVQAQNADELLEDLRRPFRRRSAR